jgi:dTDP-4-amino-4,6-dideoxygalactose transaminase
MSFNTVTELENKIADFFGAPHAVAVDCCTHGIELCLRLFNLNEINVPTRTYISIPFLASKLNLKLNWKHEDWEDYYYLTEHVIDAAVLWRRNSYIPGTFMNISFQFQKHLSLGRGGMILTDDEEDAYELKRMSYDGRKPDIPWREQNISSLGYHYYMTPETAQLGLDKFQNAVDTPPRKWKVSDWPDLTKMNVFNR